jgi:hypothetical protein
VKKPKIYEPKRSKTGWSEQDSQNKIAKAGQDSQNMRDRTG